MEDDKLFGRKVWLVISWIVFLGCLFDENSGIDLKIFFGVIAFFMTYILTKDGQHWYGNKLIPRVEKLFIGGVKTSFWLLIMAAIIMAIVGIFSMPPLTLISILLIYIAFFKR